MHQVIGTRLYLQTSRMMDDPGTYDSFILALCPGIDPAVPFSSGVTMADVAARSECYLCKFSDDGGLSLNNGDFEYIDLNADTESNGCERLEVSRESLPSRFPDDFKFVGIYPDEDDFDHGTVFSSWPFADDLGFDGWFLAGIEIHLKFAEEDRWTNVLRNPAANRVVTIYGEREDEINSEDIIYAPFSLYGDNGYVFYVETDDCDDCGTDDEIFVRMPLAEPLLPETVAYVNHYGQDRGSRFTTGPQFKSPEGATIDLVLSYDEYEDFDPGSKTSYGATLPYANGAVDKRFKICTRGSNALEIKKIRAYHFMPGTTPFINEQACDFAEYDKISKLSTDSREGVTCFPSVSDEYLTIGPGGSFQSSDSGSRCPSFDTIQWSESGSSGPYFQRR